jgi:TPR repeat protein
MADNENHSLIRRTTSAVEKAAPGAKRLLSVMVKDMLALACDTSFAHSDLDALVLEGKRIQRRQGMTPEDIQAFDLFHRAAVSGHREAQLLVFECYLDGNGVREDIEKALEWFHRSAESGFAPAQCRLADFYYHGGQDYAPAVKWYRKAAEQGDASAQCSLGLCYHDGEGVPKDYIEAVKWTSKAAEQGNVIAQNNLGVCYDRGEGVQQNYTEAFRWHQKAAENGSAGGQNDLGICYEMGQGIPQNYYEAVKWYREAAEQGNVEAQINLARCYEKIVGEFCDFLATHNPLIGDCSLLPYPKKTIHYALAWVLNGYENKREETTNQTLREKLDKIIPTFRYALTRLVDNWQEIEQEDTEAVATLSSFDSFPDWALPLKLKYLDDERASIEACEVACQVIEDKVRREKMNGADSEAR